MSLDGLRGLQLVSPQGPFENDEQLFTRLYKLSALTEDSRAVTFKDVDIVLQNTPVRAGGRFSFSPHSTHGDLPYWEVASAGLQRALWRRRKVDNDDIRVLDAGAQVPYAAMASRDVLVSESAGAPLLTAAGIANLMESLPSTVYSGVINRDRQRNSLNTVATGGALAKIDASADALTRYTEHIVDRDYLKDTMKNTRVAVFTLAAFKPTTESIEQKRLDSAIDHVIRAVGAPRAEFKDPLQQRVLNSGTRLMVVNKDGRRVLRRVLLFQVIAVNNEDRRFSLGPGIPASSQQIALLKAAPGTDLIVPPTMHKAVSAATEGRPVPHSWLIEKDGLRFIADMSSAGRVSLSLVMEFEAAIPFPISTVSFDADAFPSIEFMQSDSVVDCILEATHAFRAHVLEKELRPIRVVHGSHHGHTRRMARTTQQTLCSDATNRAIRAADSFNSMVEANVGNTETVRSFESARRGTFKPSDDVLRMVRVAVPGSALSTIRHAGGFVKQTNADSYNGVFLLPASTMKLHPVDIECDPPGKPEGVFNSKACDFIDTRNDVRPTEKVLHYPLTGVLVSPTPPPFGVEGNVFGSTGYALLSRRSDDESTALVVGFDVAAYTGALFTHSLDVNAVMSRPKTMEVACALFDACVVEKYARALSGGLSKTVLSETYARTRTYALVHLDAIAAATACRSFSARDAKFTEMLRTRQRWAVENGRGGLVERAREKRSAFLLESDEVTEAASPASTAGTTRFVDAPFFPRSSHALP